MGIELQSLLEHETEEAIHSKSERRHRVAEAIRRSRLFEGELRRADDLPAMEQLETLAAVRANEQITDGLESIEKPARVSKALSLAATKEIQETMTMMGSGQFDVPPEVLEEIDPRSA